ncbi:MAG TPA: hypothetical protein VIM30_13055 [Candidatus Limnocylindrales bacterium]|jgi:hypothetical protein
MTEAVLIGVDIEHLKSAFDGGLGQGERLVSFGTDFWSEDARENPEGFATGVPCYIYGVTRGLSEAVPYATWIARFVEYRRAESFALGDLDATRPQTTIDRRRPELSDDEREPSWAGSLMLTDLRPLDQADWVPLGRFRVHGRPFSGTLVRHPLLVGLDSSHDP